MIEMERIPTERIMDLRSRILGFLGKNVTRQTIGNLAIEAMVVRGLIETIEEKGEPSKELKEATRELRDIEKTIISLYMMTPSSEKNRSWTKLSEDYSRNHKLYYGVGER